MSAARIELETINKELKAELESLAKTEVENAENGKELDKEIQQLNVEINVHLKAISELEEKIRSALSAKKDSPDGGGNLVSGPYKNFSEAELKIQGALKDAV